MHNILIDSEFQALIPPLSAEERAQLEANLLADGCRDPLVVWVQPAPEPGTHKCYAHDESKCDLVPEDDVWHCRHCEHNPAQQEYVLIDGHNRYEICTRNGIEYSIEEMLFDDRDAVMDWMDANQLGRRNLTRDQFTLLIGRRYNRTKKTKAEAGALGGSSKAQNDTCLPTAEKLATDYGVSPATVKRAGQFADAVEVINNAAPGFTATVNAGEAPTRQDVVKAAAVVAQIPEAAQNVALAAEFADLPSEAKQEAIEAIAQLAPAQEVMREAVKKAHVANNSGNNEWYTPPKFIELARQVMGGIDLDPATSEVANRVVQAPKIFTADDDGRTQQWNGRVWMNPPVCGCRVHPKLVKLGDGNKNLPSLPESLASHIGLVLAQSGHAVSGLLVQGLRQGEGAITAARETEFPGKETKTSGGKTAVLQERKGSGEQEAAIHCGQPQAQGEASSRAVDVEQGGMGPSEARMGLRLRILRDAVGAVDTGSLHSFISSCLSGDGAKQYGPMLPELQLQQGVSDGSRLDQGQASVCPDCGLAGYSVAVPSRVFMNPPYAQPLMGDFAEAVASKYESGEIDQACILVNNGTETQWFQRMLGAADAVCFPKTRIKFLDPDGNPSGAPLQGQAILYMGGNVKAFSSLFAEEGVVLTHA